MRPCLKRAETGTAQCSDDPILIPGCYHWEGARGASLACGLEANSYLNLSGYSSVFFLFQGRGRLGTSKH